MAATAEEVASFNQFVAERMNNGGRDLSLEDLMRLWRQEGERSATVASIHRSLADFEAGRVYSLEEADALIREELCFSPRPK